MITAESCDITANRASKTDPVVANEETASSSVEKSRVDEETEPEWDVDSYDGREYESDPEAREFFGDEDRYQEYREDRIKTWKSKGFLPDEVNGIYSFGNLQYQSDDMAAHKERLTDLVSICVKKFNEHNEKTVQVDSLVRANVSGGAIWKLYITFMAREYENGPLVEYQAKVLSYAGNYKPPYPIFCRPSPKPGI